mmetsp:Transcript_33895/g.69018  ORF Transcript_33895/g.69018 Transcript_33895/m.69018 type:complete len:207 (-) Transcript_33895:881-1501(-)
MDKQAINVICHDNVLQIFRTPVQRINPHFQRFRLALILSLHCRFILSLRHIHLFDKLGTLIQHRMRHANCRKDSRSPYIRLAYRCQFRHSSNEFLDQFGIQSYHTTRCLLLVLILLFLLSISGHSPLRKSNISQNIPKLLINLAEFSCTQRILLRSLLLLILLHITLTITFMTIQRILLMNRPQRIRTKQNLIRRSMSHIIHQIRH